MNSLKTDLVGKTVVMQGEGPESQRTIKVSPNAAGFGACPYTLGTALFGIHTATGREIRVDAMEVERIVEEEPCSHL